MFNKDIYIKMYTDNSWELYNKDSLELCSESHQDYLRTFNTVFEPSDKRSDLLIIGGGDQQIATWVGLVLHDTSTLTIIDPCVNDYGRFMCFYAEDIDQIQLQDTINAGNLIFNEIPLKFSEAYPKIKNKTYHSIIIDCSEEINPDTNEIYKSKEFIRQLYKLLDKDGFLYMYIPPAAIFIKNELDKFFKLVDSNSTYIEAWEETASFYVYTKR